MLSWTVLLRSQCVVAQRLSLGVCYAFGGFDKLMIEQRGKTFGNRMLRGPCLFVYVQSRSARVTQWLR